MKYWIVLLASLAPVAVGLASRLAGSLGVVFAILAGALILLLATVLLTSDGYAVMPLVIVAVVVSYVTTQWLPLNEPITERPAWTRFGSTRRQEHRLHPLQ